MTVNVYTATQAGCTINPITPIEGNRINIGFVMQWHFVGLSTDVPASSQPALSADTSHSEPPKAFCDNDMCNDNQLSKDSPCDNKISSDDIEIDEETFQKGDQYSRQITGGPSASIEDPEEFAQIVCLAPGEGQKPLYIFTDRHLESMSNPDKCPYGRGCFSDQRPCKLTYKKYFNQRLLNVDGRFASDTDYLFTAQYIVEAKQILDDCNHFIWRQKPGSLTAGQAKDQAFVSQCLQKDKAYRFMKNVRGSPPYLPFMRC